jgi:uncharacterized membrane protein
MTSLLNIATILSVGLMIGTEFAVSAFMPFWYGLNLLLLVAEAVLLRHQPGFLLLDTAIAIWSVVIVLTLLFLVPIANRMARLTPDAPAAGALAEQQKWDSMHRVRVAALIAAMVLFLIGIHV